MGAGVKSGIAADTPASKRPELYDFSVFDEMERHVPATMRERRFHQLTFVVLDTETTGLRPERGDRIVSLAGVRVRSGIVRQSEVFDALVCPERPIPSSSARLHGITDEMVVSEIEGRFVPGQHGPLAKPKESRQHDADGRRGRLAWGNPDRPTRPTRGEPRFMEANT